MNEILLLAADDIKSILDGNEELIMNLVADAYVDHNNGNSSLPQSVFLRFPNNKSNRIIGLPAYLGGNVNAAGMKWISSFPDNINHGIERASAVLLLNNVENGRVEAILESSVISAKRTAASAALAAKLVHGNINEEVIGLIGCGRINYEIFSFLKAVYKKLRKVIAYDINQERAENFLEKLKSDNFLVQQASSVVDVLNNAPLTSFATTAGSPFLFDPSILHPNSTILGISLRDLSPDIILSSDNVVDDVEHVCRENTSIHLTEQLVGTRDFVRCTIADIITKRQPKRIEGKPVIYSPFGLGVLDLSLGVYAKSRAKEKGLGLELKKFFS